MPAFFFRWNINLHPIVSFIMATVGWNARVIAAQEQLVTLICFSLLFCLGCIVCHSITLICVLSLFYLSSHTSPSDSSLSGLPPFILLLIALFSHNPQLIKRTENPLLSTFICCHFWFLFFVFGRDLEADHVLRIPLLSKVLLEEDSSFWLDSVIPLSSRQDSFCCLNLSDLNLEPQNYLIHPFHFFLSSISILLLCIYIYKYI